MIQSLVLLVALAGLVADPGLVAAPYTGPSPVVAAPQRCTVRALQQGSGLVRTCEASR